MVSVYTESEAAGMLRMSSVTLAKLAKAGRIAFVAGGTGEHRQHRRYTQAHIDAYLSAQEESRDHKRNAELLLSAKASARSSQPMMGRYSKEALAARGLLSN